MKYLIFAAALALPVSAQVFKCEENGVVTYSQTPCAEDAEITQYSRASEEVTKPQDVITKDEVVAAAVTEGETAPETHDRLANSVKKRNIKIQIDRLQNRKKGLAKQRDAEIARLKTSKRFASNNLAGATWEESLSKEMQAITAKYATDIQSVDNDIDRLIDEHDKL